MTESHPVPVNTATHAALGGGEQLSRGGGRPPLQVSRLLYK